MTATRPLPMSSTRSRGVAAPGRSALSARPPAEGAEMARNCSSRSPHPAAEATSVVVQTETPAITPRRDRRDSLPPRPVSRPRIIASPVRATSRGRRHAAGSEHAGQARVALRRPPIDCAAVEDVEPAREREGRARRRRCPRASIRRERGKPTAMLQRRRRRDAERRIERLLPTRASVKVRPLPAGCPTLVRKHRNSARRELDRTSRKVSGGWTDGGLRVGHAGQRLASPHASEFSSPLVVFFVALPGAAGAAPVVADAGLRVLADGRRISA